MARPRRWLESDPVARALGGPHPELIADLEAAVDWHRYGASHPPLAQTLGAEERRALAALLRALKRLTNAMAAMPLDSFWRLTQDFDGGPVSRIAGPKTLGDLAKLKPRPFGSTLEEWQHATRCLLLIVRKLLEPQPRGRPRDTARLRLCGQVRDLLRSHGVAVTRGRDGRFARVLALVLDAAGESVPMDAFYLAKLAIDGVRASPRRRLPAFRSRRG